jgi:two-component system cell cycle response regulator
VSRVPRAWMHAVAGATLALGAPLGLLVLRALQAGRLSPSWLRREISADPWTYGYITVSTLVVFALFGWALGRQAARLYDLSSSDPLTRLNNRRALHERLDEEFARSLRYGSPLSVLLLDLDGLKQLNDRHGHRRGDEALERVADAIRTGSRAADVAARWGGDEFAILAPNTGRVEAVRLAERVRALAAEGNPPSEAVTVSAGVATFDLTRRLATPNDLIRAADAGLYEAKRNGRNRVVAA